VNEQELAERMGMQNPKGFRIYSSKSPAPTICAYGSEKYCGPGRHAQFIADKVEVRTLRLVEAARIIGFVPRVVDQLSTVKESLAFHMVGSAVPVETFGAITKAMVMMSPEDNETPGMQSGPHWGACAGQRCSDRGPRPHQSPYHCSVEPAPGSC
jgi:hypothetical protein